MDFCTLANTLATTSFPAAQDYIGQQGRLNLHGMDAHVDVMIESKAKELALLRLRDPTFQPTPKVLAAAVGEKEGE